MNNKFTITESEKNRILSLYSKLMPQNYYENNVHSNSSNQYSIFQKELDFQKNVHLHHISMLEGEEKNTYLLKIQNEYITGLFKNNSIILENFSNKFLNVLNESINDFTKELDKFNSFILESFKVSLVEQYTSGTLQNPYQMQADRVNKQVNDGINYIKQKGIGYVFETLRKALFSNEGTAIQIALSFTGAGNILITVAWSILGLYDLYQLVINRNMNYLGYFLVDLLCCATSGYLSKHLSALAKRTVTSVDSFIKLIMQSSAGNFVKSSLKLILDGSKTIMSIFNSGAVYMKNKMGITWASNLLKNIKPYYSKIITSISGFVSKQKSIVNTSVNNLINLKVSPLILRNKENLARKFSPEIFSKISNLTLPQMSEYIGVAAQTIKSVVLKAIEKESKAQFREKPTHEFLKWVDSKYGTPYGDIYLAYLNGKKLAKYNSSSKFLSTPEVGANSLRGEFGYTGSKADDINTGIQGIMNKVK